jgi:hypothetical protein
MPAFEYAATSMKNNLEIFISFSYKFYQIISQRNKCFFDYYLIENNFKNSHEIKMFEQLIQKRKLFSSMS